MKVLAPVENVSEVEQVIKAGADQLYCGVLSEEWLQKYTIAAINRRPARICNLSSFDELKTSVDIAHSHGVEVCLTINEHYYTQEQYPMLLEYIEKALNAKVDSFMIADLALLLYLREKDVDIEIHISTGGTTLNSETAKFYQDLGASGITIPRHLSINEIEQMVREIPDLETHVFILNSRCPNLDGFCTFMHIQSSSPSYNNACMLPFSVRPVRSKANQEERQIDDGEDYKLIASCIRQQVWERVHMDDFPCGVCAIYEFERMGIDYLKIVGRGNPTDRKITDLKFINTALSLLKEQMISKEEYRKEVRTLYRSTYRRFCRPIMCYYPEVMES